MLEELAADQASIVKTARTAIASVEAVADQASVDLFVRRIDTHEKNA